MSSKIKFYIQNDSISCGPTCLRMVARYYGKKTSILTINKITSLGYKGVSLVDLCKGAEIIGFQARMIKVNFQELVKVPFPCILHWGNYHFVVLFKANAKYLLIGDPAVGKRKVKRKDFEGLWIPSSEDRRGHALILHPGRNFYSYHDNRDEKEISFKSFIPYLKPYKKYFVQLFIGMLLGSLLQLIPPLLTQSLIDIGIANQDIGFVNIILIAQLTVLLSRTTVNFIRSWILFHIGNRLNISVLSDFLTKLMKLQISFFDQRNIGDTLARISDHRRIENFLTGSVINVLLSLLNFIVFSFILAYYNLLFFVIFLVGSTIYTAWVLFFLKYRKELDHRSFKQRSEHQSVLVQLVQGMQEIKLNGVERLKRWEWEAIRARMFKISSNSIKLNQIQQSGSLLINETKNIALTYLAAKLVIDNEITLGIMISIQYIIGQLNAPVSDFIGFTTAAQDAKISLERLTEIYNHDDESSNGQLIQYEEVITGDIRIKSLYFKYELSSDYILQDINLMLSEGTTTAIVGSSGNGKTTLLKMLLKFYPPGKGFVAVGEHKLEDVRTDIWRGYCGTVMQDGYLFNDTVANNIAVNTDEIDFARVRYAAEMACITEYITSLPDKYNTKIVSNGAAMSRGQKQRLLIARVIYKNPKYVFLDEATSALDSNTERRVVENLQKFLENKTVLVIAHRLSTVVNADNIVVLDHGKITELGTHVNLVEKRGKYYKLIKNQLELGQS